MLLKMHTKTLDVATGRELKTDSLYLRERVVTSREEAEREFALYAGKVAAQGDYMHCFAYAEKRDGEEIHLDKVINEPRSDEQGGV